MKKELNILTVDDHEMSMMGYKYILESTVFDDFTVKIDTANTYESAVLKLEESVKIHTYDIVFLDVQLSPFSNTVKKQNGEDLGVLVRKLSPESKIIFLTTYGDSYRINSILNSVNPDGYLVKTEINEVTLKEMLVKVMSGEPFYSKKALTAIRKRMANDISLDESDKLILFHLSIGTKTKDLINFIPLSLPSIENRKRHLKVLFEIERQNDQALINEAKKRGFV
mgnify:CR=1 FL=1